MLLLVLLAAGSAAFLAAASAALGPLWLVQQAAAQEAPGQGVAGTLASSAEVATAPAAPASQEPEVVVRRPTGLQARIDAAMGRVNGWIAAVFFFDLMWWDPSHTLPLVVAWLVVAAVYLTIRMGFINLRAFKHALNITRGKYTNPDEPGDVSHFQALSTALSATVGLGNIAGVAIAVSLGGPGATFWMIIAGLLGMSHQVHRVQLGDRRTGRWMPTDAFSVAPCSTCPRGSPSGAPPASGVRSPYCSRCSASGAPSAVATASRSTSR